jgi:hypothetical protein
MNDFDTIDIEALRAFCESPYPWRKLKRNGFYALDADELTWGAIGITKLLDHLPQNLLTLIHTLEIQRQNSRLDGSFVIDAIKIRAKFVTANLPWTQRELEQNTIADRDNNVVLVGEPDALQKIIYGIQHIQDVLSLLERYREHVAACRCGHERISHLFMQITSECVERPCPCEQYVAT